VRRHFGVPTATSAASPELDQMLWDLEMTMALLQQQLLRAQEHMRRQADKHRTERVFQVCNKAYLCLQPYIQTSIARHSTQKLAFKYYGPYQILRRVGVVSYKLALPAGSHIHDVVHVSQLKCHLPLTQRVSDDQSAMLLHFALDLQPLSIAETRYIQHGGMTVPQFKVVWDTATPPTTTWEDVFTLQASFQLSRDGACHGLAC
jgi:hypothetical protein